MLGALLLSLTAADATAQSPLLFVESYNKLLEEKKVAAGVDYRIEGRISSIAPNLLKLQNCGQVFRPASGETFGKAPGNRGVVELFGRLEIQDGKQVFVVDKLRFLRNDADTYLLKKAAVRGDKAEDWYDLAQWASRRAEFYDDGELRELAVEAHRGGIAVERRQMPEVNPASLLKLAEKAAALELPEAVRLEYVHESYRLRWDQLQQARRPDLKPLVNDIETQLPGAADRLPTPQPELETSYRENPQSVYRRADDAARKKLHRIFYSDVLLASILREARADGRSGFEVADAIDEALPELHPLAEEQREQELKDRQARVARLTRQEMLDLADRFRRRKQTAAADETVKRWLKATEEQLREEGPAGLMRAADEYVDLLEDREQAVALLQEAYRLSPDSERIAEKLMRLDYRLHNGEWIPAGQFNALPVSEIQQAIRAGRVIEGMTAADVRSTLGAATSVTRIATAGQISELWIYGEQNATRLTVHLLRRTPRSPLTAVKISQISAR